jgi:hypothetical protein
MKCQEFMDRWLDGKGISRVKLRLLFHWLKCKRCRGEVAFLHRLARTLRRGDEGVDPSLAWVRREVVRAAMEEGLVTRASSPDSSPRVSRRFSLSLVGIFAVLAVVFLVVAGPGKRGWTPVEVVSWIGSGGEVVVSQLDDETLKELDTTLEGAFKGDPSIVFDLTIAPWAEVMDQVSAHPNLLDSILPHERGERGPLQKRGGVA